VLADSDRRDLVRDLLTRQLGNSFPLTAGGGTTANRQAISLFTALPERLAFPILRRPGQGPAGLVLAVFDISRQDGVNRLIYREYPFRPGALVAVADLPTRSTLLLQDQGSMRFSYRGPGGNWQDSWNGAAPPALVALATADWPLLVARPQAAPGVAAATP
jgi:hypothetical protein